MDFTQTEFMRNKKERSRDEAKDHKEMKKSFAAKAIQDKVAQMCIEEFDGFYGYGGYGNSESSNDSPLMVHAAVDDLYQDSEDDELERHIYVDDPYKRWRRCATAFMEQHLNGSS